MSVTTHMAIPENWMLIVTLWERIWKALIQGELFSCGNIRVPEEDVSPASLKTSWKPWAPLGTPLERSVLCYIVSSPLSQAESPLLGPARLL